MSNQFDFSMFIKLFDNGTPPRESSATIRRLSTDELNETATDDYIAAVLQSYLYIYIYI